MVSNDLRTRIVKYIFHYESIHQIKQKGINQKRWGLIKSLSDNSLKYLIDEDAEIRFHSIKRKLKDLYNNNSILC